MYRKTMGFNGSPLCIIWWQKNGEDAHKTVCYTDDDKKWALDRFDTVGDHYNTSFDEPQFDYGAEERCVRHPYLLGIEITVKERDDIVSERKGVWGWLKRFLCTMTWWRIA